MSSQWTFRIVTGLVIATLLYWFIPNESNPRPEYWNIQIEKNEISILGLNLHTSHLKDINLIFENRPEIAMFTKRQHAGEPVPSMRLEAYYKDLFNENDHIIVGLTADDKLLQKIKDDAYQPTLFPNNVIRIGIKDARLPTINQLTIQSITIIPGGTIDTKEFDAKFGAPTQHINDGQGNAHFLHPAMGLDFIQPSEGNQVLQFVSPDQFKTELLTPLMSLRGTSNE